MAFGASTFTDAGGAVSDLFAAEGDRTKAQGDYLEAQNYDLATHLADQNEQFTKTSTAIKQAQNDRNIYQTIGGESADIAGGGLAASGSSLDLLRDSAAQGALTKAVAGTQGLITEAGYQEQAESYQNLSEAATMAGNAENNAALGADISGGFKIAASIATLGSGGNPLSSIGNLFMGGGSPSGL